MKIYLDDIRFPPGSGWSVIRTVDDFVLTWGRNREDITYISFDHDLGNGDDTGYDALRLVLRGIENGVKVHPDLRLVVHSMNFEEARKMREDISKLMGGAGR